MNTTTATKPAAVKVPDATLEDVLELGMLDAADVLKGLALSARKFSTGSYGLFGNGKVTIARKGAIGIRCQVTCTVTVIGSKPAAKGE